MRRSLTILVLCLAGISCNSDSPGTNDKGRPDRSRIDALATDSARDVATSDGKPDVAKPDVAKHDMRTDAPEADVKKPDLKTDAPKADVKKPDLAKPDVSKPDLKKDILKPDLLTPDTLKPDLLKPDLLKPDAFVPKSCAAGSKAEQTFGKTMYGCAGTVGFSSRATLCKSSDHVCSAAEWVKQRASGAPSYNYWTNDSLKYNGTSSACWVSTTTGSSCSSDAPMRVCGAQTDPLGNTCNWTGCGYSTFPPSEYFGGCNGNFTAGTLCCRNACSTAASGFQPFLYGMTGCFGSVTYANRATLCNTGYHVCAPLEWLGWHGTDVPSHHYWMENNTLKINISIQGCWLDGTTGSTCGSPRVCHGYTDPLGNTCNYVDCGFGAAPPPQHYLGGCSGSVNLNAGTLCCPD
jgi:hypothetical protein